MNTQPSINSVVTDPELADLLNLLKLEIFRDLNCHHLATIQSFDEELQTCTATINYSKTVFQPNASTGQYEPVQVNYPLLADMPVVFLGGNFTFPVMQGMQALILINDRSIDNWFQSGLSGPLNSNRAHHLSDGIALVGLSFSTKPIPNFDNSRVVMRNLLGTTGVGVGSTMVKIFNALNGSLGPNFTAFFTALNAFMSACEGSSTDPVLAAAASAFAAAMAVPVAPSLEGPIQNIEGILE